MLNGIALNAALTTAPRVSFRNLTYRAIHLAHFSSLVTSQPLFTPAGGTVGSRYVAPGGPESLYVALEPETAYRELNQSFLNLAATPLGARQVENGALRPYPFVTLGIHVDIPHVLDLSDSSVRQQLGIRRMTQLMGRWRNVSNAITQVLGAAVFASNRYQGILYPSAQHLKHNCLVVLSPRLAAPAHLFPRHAVPTHGAIALITAARHGAGE